MDRVHIVNDSKYILILHKSQ